MSTALRKFEFAHIKEYTVASGQTATAGRCAVFSGSDTEVDDAGADSDLVIGIFLTTAAAGARTSLALFGPVVPVVVGTGGATRGKKAVPVSDGVTDAATLADGDTAKPTVGIFMQSGTAGQTVGMQLCRGIQESV